jgi:hypothetical protein
MATGVTARLNARFGMGPTMLGGIAGTGIAWLVIGSAYGSFWTVAIIFGAGLFALDLTAMVFFVNYLSVRQAVTPDRLLGRVTATLICLTVATAPLGGSAALGSASIGDCARRCFSPAWRAAAGAPGGVAFAADVDARATGPARAGA